MDEILNQHNTLYTGSVGRWEGGGGDWGEVGVMGTFGTS